MAHPGAPTTTGFERRLGLFQATTVNMTPICGIGPFVTIPCRSRRCKVPNQRRSYPLTADVEAISWDPPSPVTRGGEVPQASVSA